MAVGLTRPVGGGGRIGPTNKAEGGPEAAWGGGLEAEGDGGPEAEGGPEGGRGSSTRRVTGPFRMIGGLNEEKSGKIKH